MSTAEDLTTPPFVERLREALEKGLKDSDIPAEVSYERAGRTKLYRFSVIADRFSDLGHSERQDLVWRIAQQAISPSDQIKISMILTLTRDESGAPSW